MYHATMTSLMKVAQAAGVSRTTASIVLNGTKQENRVSAECSERVRAVAQRLGYVRNYHARSMKLGRAETLAVALDVGFLDKKKATRGELASNYFAQLVGGMEVSARNAGHALAIVGPDARRRAPDRGVLGIQQRQFDGLIVPGLIVRTHLTNFLNEPADLPVAVVESPIPTEWPTINFDAASGIRQLVAHLAQLGHRELLWVNLEGRRPDVSRQQAFIETAWEAGLRGAMLKITQGEQPLSLVGRIETIEKAVIRYFREKTDRQFTAVVAYNDSVAIGVCSALAKLNLRIPKDISVVGFDDIEAPLCIPRLTTVSHRLHEMGARAADKVLEMIDNPERRQAYRGTCEIIQPELIIRESTGPVPA